MKEKDRILVLDDNLDMAESVGLMLTRAGYQCAVSSETGKAVDLIDDSHPELVVAGPKMSGLNGLDLIELIKKDHPSLPVIIVTGSATIDAAVEAMKKGADDFLSKPFHADDLLLKIKKALNHARVLDENRYLREEMQATSSLPEIIGKSDAMRRVFETLERLKESECRVLLTGESGTGKEVISRAIHRMSPRRDEKFFAINCAALTETLLESELFGHEKGSFTGAIASKKGLFELADRGTLYLDEIGDTSLAFQAKLLRAVEENEFKRVGGTKNLTVDVRIISSTNKELKKEIGKGSFREDLLYRLSVVHIPLPPLRERREDIPLLVDYFLRKLSFRMVKKVAGISKKAMDAMMAYSWPGNIRELENAVERGMIMTRGSSIGPEDLPLGAMAVDVDKAGAEELTTLEGLEKKLIERTLIECNWNKTLAARRIGIGRRTLYDKATRYGIPMKPNGD